MGTPCTASYWGLGTSCLELFKDNYFDHHHLLTNPTKLIVTCNQGLASDSATGVDEANSYLIDHGMNTSTSQMSQKNKPRAKVPEAGGKPLCKPGKSWHT